MVEHYLDRLARTINENWDQPALTDFYLSEDGTAQDTSRGNHYTYGEMYAELCRVAELLTSLGLQKGDHIAICGANSAHWVIAYLAIAKMQGVSVTVMHSLLPEEIARLVDFSDAKALFTDEDLWEELKSLPLPQVENIISLENFESLASGTSIIASSVSSASSETSASSPSIVGFPQSAPDTLAMICFTSGTTNKPKGVMLPYRSLSNNVYNMTKRYLDEKISNYIIYLPLAHMAGLVAELLPQIVRGKHLYIFMSPPSLINLNIGISIIKPYMMTMVPQTVIAIGKEFGYQRLLNLKQLLVGCAILKPSEENEILSIGVPLIIGYGQTEVGAAISIPFGEAHKMSASGTILSGMTASIAPNGEILVKGENVMLGYYKDPEATARKIDSDGWLHTGDKGHLDEDGYLYVEGRLEQDIIVLPNGENIRPDNIESLINALPEVSESIVLARDGRLVAIVVPSSESRETSETRASSPSTSLRRHILRNVNPQLPLFSQLYDVEITDTPLAKTEKQTIKRYLYK